MPEDNVQAVNAVDLHKSIQSADTAASAATTNTPDIQKVIQDAVEKAVGGLKAKNTELLGEVKAAKEALKRWDGYDPENVRKIVDQFSNDADAQAIREGRFNDVIDRRTKETVTRAQTQMENEARAREEATRRADELQVKYHSAVIGNAVAQLVTGLADGALAPVQLYAQQWFSVLETGEIVPTDKAPLWPKAERLGIDQLKAYLQETNGFYFKQPIGGGAVAGRAGGTPTKTRAAMTPAERAKLISDIGGDAYLALP